MNESEQTSGGSRTVVAIGLGLFVLSTMFPLVAGVLRNPAPRWVGMVDVVVAFALFIQAIVITKRAAKPDAYVVGASLRVVRGGANLLLGLIVVFFLVGHRIKWDVLLLGLAWRAWLFVWVLPSALTLWRSGSSMGSLQAEAGGKTSRVPIAAEPAPLLGVRDEQR